MKRDIFFSFLLFIGYLFSPVSVVLAQTAPSRLQLDIAVDRNWIFDQKHLPHFSLTLTSPECINGSLLINVTTDFGEIISSQTKKYTFATDSPVLDSLGFRSHISFELKDLIPGFYHVMILAEKDTLRQFSFGYEPEMILSDPDKPEGFDQFWQQTLAELESVKPEYKMSLLKEASTLERQVYEVEMKSLGGETIRGYWAAPTDKGKHPAVVVYQGYGAITWIPGENDYPGWCVLVIPPRGQGLNLPYNRFGEWMTYGLDSPLRYYYRGAFMDTVRSIDFVFEQSEYDGKNLFVTGISQGGGLCLVAASLDKRVTAAAPIVPFLADYPDYFRIVPWPASLVYAEAGKQNLTQDEVLSVMSYFDLKNLTERITCPVLMGFGLQDDITPPHTNFAAYNQIRSPKRWICYPLSGHLAAYDYMENWIEESLRFFKKSLHSFARN
ncbi:acetylxylan esterase [Parabacteroides goldsteinii]|uniref:acetylxylan esterase n=1 Tax=Parabacteroides goldsteinii TaxID=328812 RepID=UPI002165A50C|nr:acetylxylan esterase [Parabacteroides goldsteinii]MCS2425004.1 acetylxylan esterase [Parabacteroides goldsteinii]